jgi:CRP-like cAMP-binding protein
VLELVRLTRLPFFQGLPQAALVALARTATEGTLPSGYDLVRQYDRARAVHVLVRGRVQVLLRVGEQDLLVGVLQEPGHLLGWSAFRPPYRYTATVRCESEVRVVSVPAEVFTDLFADDPALEYAVLRRVVAAVAERFEHARALLGDPRTSRSAP